MTCTHELPQGCCKLCATERKVAQTPPEHMDDGLGLITSVSPAEDGDGWTCKVFAIGGRLIDSHTVRAMDFDGAVEFAEWMASIIRESADWADWRESQRRPQAVL